MELRRNMRLAATRPIAWLTALLIGLVLVLISWYALQSSATTHPTGVGTPLMTSGDQPRNGDPGGQFGDSDQTSRVGGPGGQIGDAP